MKIRIIAALIAATLSHAPLAAEPVPLANDGKGAEAACMAIHACDPGDRPLVVAVARGGNDPTAAALYGRAPDVAQVAEPGYGDNIAASFARMLGHSAYAGPTAVAVELGTPDPVERMIFEMLKDVRQPVRYARG